MPKNPSKKGIYTSYLEENRSWMSYRRIGTGFEAMSIQPALPSLEGSPIDPEQTHYKPDSRSRLFSAPHQQSTVSSLTCATMDGPARICRLRVATRREMMQPKFARPGHLHEISMTSFFDSPSQFHVAAPYTAENTDPMFLPRPCCSTVAPKRLVVNLLLQ